MPNPQHVSKLKEGVRAWNAWRSENPCIEPELSDLNLPVGHRQFGSVQGGPIDLSHVDLSRAALEHATLIDADLTASALVQADLSYARMMRADLRGANLSNACLDHADLKDAQLDEAMVCGTQLRHARNLTQEQIDQACGDESTALPLDLAIPAAWLKDERGPSSELARRITFRMDDLRADPYTLLGVRHTASIQEVRAAYLKLVKELHPDGRAPDPIAGERLKLINKAYQDLKGRERRAAARRAESGLLGRPGALFVVGFLASTISISAVFGGLYYSGFFGPDEIRRTAMEEQRVPPARTGALSDTTTGSISEPPSRPSENREAASVTQGNFSTPDEQETATREQDVAALASARDAADDAAWIEARREGTSVSLHRYVGRYPNGRHAREAAADLATVVNSEVVLDKSYDGRDAPAMEAARLTLRRYLDVYPDGGLAAEVQRKLKAIDMAEVTVLADNTAWAEAERNATSETLRRYLAAYPDGNNAANAQRAIATIEAAEARQQADHAAWAEAEQDGTREGLRRYLAAYPGGNNAAKAHQALAALEATEARRQADRTAWAEAVQDGTREALRRYLDAHPDGDNVATAQQKLALLKAAEAAGSERVQDDADWLKAQRRHTKASYAAYLGAYPNGRHAKTARSSITELENLASKAGPVADIKGSKLRPQTLRTGTIDAPASQKWQSADEPFIGADGRIRQR